MSTATTTPNHWEQSARAIKAAKLAKFFARKGVDGEDLAFMDDAGWKAAAKVAGIRVPSATTRKAVIDLLTSER